MEVKNPIDLDHHLPSQVTILSGRIALHAVRTSARKLGMSLREWRIIQILGCDGPSTITEVAERVAMDQGGTSRSIANLEERGFLFREIDTGDRRRSRVALSADGCLAHNEIVSYCHAREERLLSKLSRSERDEIDRLLALLTSEIDSMIADELVLEA